MRKRKVLICDNEPDQHNNLRTIVQSCDFVPIGVNHYDLVLEKLAKEWPVHLLILDLGYDVDKQDAFIGWKCLAEIEKSYPSLPVLIYSTAVTAVETKEANSDLASLVGTLKERPSIRGVGGPHEDRKHTADQIKSIVGTDWLENDELFVLHISDLQMGGKGLLEKFSKPASELAKQICDDIDAYCASTEDTTFPHLCLLSGDLTHHGRPDEFAAAQEFCKHLGRYIVEHHPSCEGLLGDRPNVLAVPGNHDLNWDVSRGRNLHLRKITDPASGDKDNYRIEYDKNEQRAELEFLAEYAWRPYGDVMGQSMFEKASWAWDPGFQIIDITDEVGLMIICVNSARWSCRHKPGPQEDRVDIPSDVVKSLNEEINRRQSAKKFGSSCSHTNVLLMHHTLDHATALKHRLHITGRDCRTSVSELYRNTGFRVALTGHIHENVATPVETDGDEGDVAVQIGAGTLTNKDRPEYRNPAFNLIRFWDRAAGSKVYRKVTVHVLGYDGARFVPQTVFSNRQKSSRTFDLV